MGLSHNIIFCYTTFSFKAIILVSFSDAAKLQSLAKPHQTEHRY
jgi:hypothetical protein